jgi:hypothetical protein
MRIVMSLYFVNNLYEEVSPAILISLPVLENGDGQSVFDPMRLFCPGLGVRLELPIIQVAHEQL